MADRGANATAYIPTDASAKCEFILLTHAVFLQDPATLWCFYLFLNRKFDFFFFCPLTWLLWIFFFFAALHFHFFGSYHEKQAFFFLELWGLGTVFVARLINGACLV